MFLLGERLGVWLELSALDAAAAVVAVLPGVAHVDDVTVAVGSEVGAAPAAAADAVVGGVIAAAESEDFAPGEKYLDLATEHYLSLSSDD